MHIEGDAQLFAERLDIVEALNAANLLVVVELDYHYAGIIHRFGRAALLCVLEDLVVLWVVKRSAHAVGTRQMGMNYHCLTWYELYIYICSIIVTK